MKIGLRVDVDTFRGTRAGVPALLEIFSANCIRASFFFSAGPDNMGRHLRRLFKPAFLMKMLRSRAGKLYGWDILLRGTIWPGPVIGEKCREIIRAADAAGHEIGLHAWDHHKWQAGIEKMDASAIHAELRRGFEMLADVIGRPVNCSAVPGWKCAEQVLVEKLKFPFVYNSDCRGASVFFPVVAGRRLAQPQVPVTLPTYDEVAGRNGVSSESFGDYVLSQLRPDKLNVLTIHAEAEGIAVKDEFIKLIKNAKALGHEFCPLGALIVAADVIPAGIISEGKIPGREGWVSVQGAWNQEH
ncbi:MAG: 4-deoxy-4-formamido-L-arabinose-phosphoundecaprenol deformylase [Kiritimatiellae bacterium]|nr:4-deoxy-4-formamido-L-arabinose-phosphoundecaprenol deformylase [Kiritimatiellia bacterium]